MHLESKVETFPIKILSANTFWFTRQRRLERIIKHISPQIVCLQEIPSYAQVVSASFSMAESIESRNNFRTDFAQQVRNVTLSTLRSVGSGILFEHGVESHGYMLAPNVLWSEYGVRGKLLRVYNCHFPAFDCGIEERTALLESIVKHALNIESVVICGDMNTVIPKKGFIRSMTMLRIKRGTNETKINYDWLDGSECQHFSDKIISLGYKHAFGIDQHTWRFPLPFAALFENKLDWLIFKGISLQSAEIGEYIFDHKMLIGTFEI